MHKRSSSCQRRRFKSALVGSVILAATAISFEVQALLVRAEVVGTLQVDSNFNDGTRSTAQTAVTEQTPVPDTLPPLFGLRQGTASADGSAGTLKVNIDISSPGNGTTNTGIIAGATLEMQAFMEETFTIRTLSSPPASTSFRPGLSGLGDPNDNFITLRAKGTLTGSGSVGSATGVPPGTSVGSAGSTRAVHTLTLGVVGGGLSGGFSHTETTSLIAVTNSGVDTNRNINFGNIVVDGDTVTMNIRKDLFSTTNDRVILTSSLTAFARVGNFAGAQAHAAYGNSAYLDFDIEDGMYWLPGNPGNRSFLAQQVFPPAPVPLPGAVWLLGSALVAVARIRRPSADQR